MKYPASMLALRAAGLGAVSGLRSMSGPAALAWIAGDKPERFAGTMFGPLATPEAGLLVSLMALGEMGVDKLPLLPPRTSPAPLAVRVILGAAVGAGAFVAEKQPAIAGALFGAAGAILASYAGYFYRSGVAKKTGLPDLPLALLEDGLTIALGRALVKDANGSSPSVVF